MSTETKNQNTIVFILLIVLFTAAGFFAGTKYQQSKQSSVFRQQFNNRGPVNNGQPIRGRNGLGAHQTIGEIISQDDKSVTVKLPDGSSKIILLSETTSINKATEVSKMDLKVGDRIAVFGTENTDGSITAQNIQLNPVLRGQNLTP